MAKDIMVKEIEEKLRKVVSFFKNNYLLFLTLIVFISFGQMFGMLPWEDDNAILVKFMDMDQPAGFLGKGFWGEGPYKYTAAFYYPIYYLFGYSAPAFLGYGFVMYLLSVFVIYKVVSSVLGEKYGKISSFIYAAGYIASDGIIRMFNSVVTSLSVILTSGFLYFYWKNSKKRNVVSYLLSVLLFFSAIEFTRVRTHYLIASVILFELVSFPYLKKMKGKLKGARNALLRLLPFIYIFYIYFIKNGDPRAGRVGVFINSLIKGDFSQAFGFFSTLTNLIIPDYLTNRFNLMQGAPLYLMLGLLFVILFSLFVKNKKKMVLIGGLLLVFLWYQLSRNIFNTPLLNLNINQTSLAFLGVVIFTFFISVIFVIKKEVKKTYLFFLLWFFASIASYSAYLPTTIFGTMHRYFAHSFFVLAIFYSVFLMGINNVILKKLLTFAVILLGVTNLYKSFNFQRWVLEERSRPVVAFYDELKKDLPEIKKGDVLYFDVKRDSDRYFRNAIAVSQMPDEGSISWRYGIYRYDFKNIYDFEALEALIKNGEVNIDQVKTYYYSKETGLVPTTEEFRKLFSGKISKSNYVINMSFQSELLKGDKGTLWIAGEMVYDVVSDISCVVKPRISLGLSGSSVNVNNISFPLYSNKSDLTKKDISINEAFDYLRSKNIFLANSRVFVSTEWQERVGLNLIDGDSGTRWQAHRVLWKSAFEYFGFDLGSIQSFDRLVWINGFANSSPTKYFVEVSNDKTNWVKVGEFVNSERLEAGVLQETAFKPQTARYVRVVFTETLDSDSPSISEAWIVPSRLTSLNIAEVESYLHNPFSLIDSKESYYKTVELLGNKGEVQIYWKSDASDAWETDFNSKAEIVNDGLIREYEFKIPCKGMKLEKIMIVPKSFPGTLNLHSLNYSYD